MKSKKTTITLAIMLGVIILLTSLKFSSTPYSWIFFGWAIIFLLTAIDSKKSITKVVLLNVSIIFMTIGSFEVYLWIDKDNKIKNRPKRTFQSPNGEEFHVDSYKSQHDFLGYAPLKNITGSVIKRYRDELIYNAVFTTDSNGLRISPPYKPQNNMECLLFFGGSFTFGEGVNDDETLPYVTGIETNGKYRIYNFGVNGYGTHQMLSALEHQIVENIVTDCEPRYAIYQALLPAHIRRSAGLAFWDKHGPKYLLKDGKVVFSGHFDDDNLHNQVKNFFKLNSFLIYKRIFHKINRSDIDLFIGIVESSREHLENRYPNLKFHLIAWGRVKDYDDVLRRLQENGINIHLINDILPNFEGRGWKKYTIHQRDAHPNPLAYKLLAKYVVNKIIK